MALNNPEIVPYLIEYKWSEGQGEGEGEMSVFDVVMHAAGCCLPVFA